MVGDPLAVADKPKLAQPLRLGNRVADTLDDGVADHAARVVKEVG